MVRLAFCADAHLANHKKLGGPVKSSLNRRCRQALDVLAKAVDVASSNEADALFILGDLFDTTRPPPQLIAETMRALDSPVPVYVLVGNHDQVSFAQEDNALAPLPLGPDGVRVIEQPEIITIKGSGKKDVPVHVLCVPFHPGHTADWLPGLVANQQWGLVDAVPKGKRPVKGTRLLALHQGIRHADTSKFLRKAEDAIDLGSLSALMEKHEIQYTLAGHWHDHFWSRTACVMQIGALVPTGFDNPGFGYGHVVLWENGGIWLKHVHGPRFLKLSAASSLEPGTDWDGHDVYLSVEVPAPEHAHDVLDQLDLLAAERMIVSGEVTIATQAAQEQARRAALAARSTETLDQALAEYVEEMALPEGVDRGAVLARTQEYLEDG